MSEGLTQEEREKLQSRIDMMVARKRGEAAAEPSGLVAKLLENPVGGMPTAHCYTAIGEWYQTAETREQLEAEIAALRAGPLPEPQRYEDVAHHAKG
jgi:hypothetical protein